MEEGQDAVRPFPVEVGGEAGYAAGRRAARPVGARAACDELAEGAADTRLVSGEGAAQQRQDVGEGRFRYGGEPGVDQAEQPLVVDEEQPAAGGPAA